MFSIVVLSSKQEEHPTAEVEAVATGVNRLEGCIFVGHTNTDTDRQVVDIFVVVMNVYRLLVDFILFHSFGHTQRGERRRGRAPLQRHRGAQRGECQRCIMESVWVYGVGSLCTNFA